MQELLSIILLLILAVVEGQEGVGEWKCPQHWVPFQQSCYRFIKSPIRNRNDARRNCQAYESDLVSINNLDEHGFLVNQLLWQDPQHRRWYISAHEQSSGYWVNEGDGTPLTDMEPAFLPEQESNQPKPNLVYSFSNTLRRWGLERVTGEDLLLYICEAPLANVHNMVTEDRSYDYGLDIDDPEKIPCGPYFINQPVNVVFDLSKKTLNNDVSLSCLAGGYPTPTYDWFKEDYENDKLMAKKIDPLSDSRYTVSGGTLIIHDPKQIEDRGSYHCKATNNFGTIVSETVTLSFGYIAEFNMKRSPESGNENWGKAIFCDPPQHFPGIKYYWVRDYFPNFVEEDKRVFVSFDGAVYFSALETIDEGRYSCSVQSKVSDNGRNGPFFPLRVNPHSNYQQLKFPNNFPKAFPEAPVAGKEVRLECVAFGYPVPTYNWTRRGAPLPRGAMTLNYNRVLLIPHVQVEDQGEYVCRVYNDRAAIENSVVLSIQAEPNFTIPLMDRHMDNGGELTWTCEAFGIPDVNYVWFRNGKELIIDELPEADRVRYTVQDNVLTIRHLNPEKDPAMYQCRANNLLKTRYSSAQLRVLSLRPSFKKRPLEPETYAAEGGNVTLYCRPEAAPRPKFVWKKDGTVLGSTGRRRVLDNGNLLISPVSRDDDGLYTCTASNTYGSDESQGRLIVLRGPSLVEAMDPRIITAVRRDVVLRCQAASEEILDLAYIWTHNGLRIVNTDYRNTRIRNDDGTLEIHNITFAEAGDYECIVKSAVGRISTKTNVIVEGPPGPPGGVQADIIKTSAVIYWTDGATNGRPVTHYIISGRTNWNSTWFNVSEEVIALEVNRYNGRKKAQIENVLVPWSTYEFRVSAANMLGYGIPSAPSPMYNTPPAIPTIAPSKVSGGGGKIGELTITWKPLDRKDQNGPGVYYIVYWRLRGHEKEFQSVNLRHAGGSISSTVVRIELDKYYTKYDVKVQAGNKEGIGPESKAEVIYSAEDMPQVAPQQVSARSFNSTALNVSWIPIDLSRENIRGKLIGHRLKYWKKDNREEDAVYYLSRSPKPWALIVGLQPNTYYFVKVMAYNSAGEGPESERFLEKTFRKAPQKPPSSVFIYSVNPTTARVVWRYVAPSVEEEPVIGYKIRVWEADQDISRANDTIILVGSKLEAYVTNLTPGKRYLMRVLAFSNGGDGRMSSPTVQFQIGDEKLLLKNESNRLSFSNLCVAVMLLILTFKYEINFRHWFW
ncbi:contactin [Lycorma delicatula]|uniref:contactin n=1 Tax=Lycorma delicatula TaxID=130591 RepID=UPI003F50F018